MLIVRSLEMHTVSKPTFNLHDQDLLRKSIRVLYGGKVSSEKVVISVAELFG